MTKRKNMTAKIFAFLALFGIILGIIGTGVLFIFNKTQVTQEKNTTIDYKK